MVYALQVSVGVGMVSIWTCLVWAERSTPGSFWVPRHSLNSTTGGQKGITQTITLTLSQPVACLTH